MKSLKFNLKFNLKLSLTFRDVATFCAAVSAASLTALGVRLKRRTKRGLLTTAAEATSKVAA